MPKPKGTTAAFIQKAKDKHGDRYDYTKLIYAGSANKVTIICKLHNHEFLQKAAHHLEGHGCKLCAKESRSTQISSNDQDFIIAAKKIHGDRYDYSKVLYTRSKINVTIICRDHGEFNQTPSVHLKGSGCAICSGGGRSSNTQEFIKKAICVHSDRYDYSKVNYDGRGNNITIICKIHGEFLQTPNAHLRGCGCQKCGGKLKSSTLEFIDRAITIHNGVYSYADVKYTRCDKKINIICHKHGVFIQTPQHHLEGRGCPKCAKRGFSKMQIQWLEFLEKFNNITIQHIGNSMQEHRIKSTRWKADGYCKETNAIYEFHGDFWHGNPKRYDPEFINVVTKRKMKTLYAKTVYREERIIELGYKLHVMWESDWVNINKSIRKIQRVFRLSRSQ